MGTRIAVVAALGSGLVMAACSTAPQPSGPSEGPASREGHREETTIPTVVPRLPPPHESVLATQKALLLPEGMVRTDDGRIYAVKDGAELVFVPAGEFTMGDDASSEADEKPAHRVNLSAHFMDRHEVTNAQFARFVSETGYRTDAEWQGVSHVLVGDDFKDIQGADWKHPGGPGTDIAGLENHPVVLVSWFDSKAYCDWAGRRLPTEAEFERALRAGVEGAKYPWGDAEVPPPNSVNCLDEATGGAHPKWKIVNGYRDGHAHAAPVASLPQNALGMFDTSGNVWEWCSDWFSVEYYGNTPAADPRGPLYPAGTEPFTKRVVRGGGWDSDLFGLRSSCRDRGVPGLRHVYFGFRAARSLR